MKEECKIRRGRDKGIVAGEAGCVEGSKPRGLVEVPHSRVAFHDRIRPSWGVPPPEHPEEFEELDDDDLEESSLTPARMGFMERIRAMPLADLSIVLAIFQLVTLIPCALIFTVVRHQSGNTEQAAITGIAAWIAPAALMIWIVGSKKDESLPNTNLRIFHTLPAVLLIFLLIRGGVDAVFITTLFNFVDFVLLLALFIYGFLCLRHWIRPPLAYAFYLISSIAAFLIMLSRI